MLNRSTSTRIPFFLSASSGNPKMKSIETDCQHSAGIVRGYSDARDEGIGFTRRHTSQERMFAHELILAGPVKVATYREISLFPTTMPTCWCIVTLIKDAQSQTIMSGNDDTRSVTGNGCIKQQPVASCVSIRGRSIQAR